MPFQTKFGPNRLSINDLWKLYKELKPALDGKSSELFIDEIIRIMQSIDTDAFKLSLKIMYGDKINYLEKSAMELGIMFSEGIRQSNILLFSDFIRKLPVVPSKR